MVWSDWRRIEQPAKYNGPAVYRIRLCNSGAPVSIKRFLDSDDHGLLCIGKTANLDRRRKEFISGRAKGRGHSEANLLHILEKVTSLAANYPNREYEYSYIKIESLGENNMEEENIKTYVKRFGEVPPLNSAIPKRYEWKC